MVQLFEGKIAVIVSALGLEWVPSNPRIFREKSQLQLSVLDLALRIWNRERCFKGSSNTKDIENVRKICYEFLDRTQDLKANTELKAVGVLATLGDITKVSELLIERETQDFHDVAAIKNVLLCALSDYNSYKDIFWKLMESNLFHYEDIGSKRQGV